MLPANAGNSNPVPAWVINTVSLASGFTASVEKSLVIMPSPVNCKIPIRRLVLFPVWQVTICRQDNGFPGGHL